MARRGKIPTYQSMINLLDRAEAGDENALREAQFLSAKLAKRANVRLSDLEQRGFEASPAYLRVRDIMSEENLSGRVRFSESKKLSAEQLETQLEELSVFLGAESSTGAGEALRRTGIDTMLETGIIEIKDENKNKIKRGLQRFLESDEWNIYRKTVGYVKGTMQTVVNALERGAKLTDFRKMVREELQKERPSGDLVAKWAEV